MARLISNINDNRIRYVVPVEISSSLSITGSILTTAGITGSIQGTASIALTALTSSHVNTLNQNVILSGSLTARQTGFNASGVFTGETIGSIALTTTASNGFSLFTIGDAFQIYDNTNAATRFTLSSGGDISVNAITSSGIVSTGSVGIGTNAPNAVLHVDGTVRIDNQTGTPSSLAGSVGTVNQYWGTADGDFLSTPTVWLKINIGGSDYYFPGYE